MLQQTPFQKGWVLMMPHPLASLKFAHAVATQLAALRAFLCKVGQIARNFASPGQLDNWRMETPTVLRREWQRLLDGYAFGLMSSPCADMDGQGLETIQVSNMETAQFLVTVLESFPLTCRRSLAGGGRTPRSCPCSWT